MSHVMVIPESSGKLRTGKASSHVQQQPEDLFA